MSSVTISVQGVPKWLEMGPAPVVDGAGKVLGTGAIIAVAADPVAEGTLYVATASGGVWRTRDATADNLSPAWSPLTDQHPSTALGAIALSPLDPAHRTLFVGTGTFSSFPPSGPAVGLYRSTDGGDSWSVVGRNVMEGRRIRAVLPTSFLTPTGQVVLAAGLDWRWQGSALAGVGGVFRSQDGGDSFTLLSGAQQSGLPLGEAWALVEDPGKAGRVFAAIHGVQSGDTGVYRSDDGGGSWTATAAGLDATRLAAATSIRLAIGSEPGTGVTTLYAGVVNPALKSDGTQEGNQLAGLFQTSVSDSAEQWTEIPLPPGGGGAINPIREAVWKFAMACRPSSHAIFLGGDGGGIWRGDISDPANPSWEQVSRIEATAGPNVTSAAPHDDCQDLVFDASGDLLATTDGGIFRLRNPHKERGKGRREWVSIGEQIGNDEVFSVAYDTLNRIAWVGSGDNGCSEQPRPATRKWVTIGGGDGGGQAVDNDNGDFTWRYSMSNTFGPGLENVERRRVDHTNRAAPAEPLMFASAADPATRGSGLRDTDKAKAGYYALNNLAGHRSQILVGSDGLYESVDSGGTVSEITVPDATGAAQTGFGPFAYGAMEGDTPRPEVVYVGVGGASSRRLWIRKPGATALAQAASYPGGTVIAIALDPRDWRRAYVADVTRVYLTTTGGADWHECTGNLLAVATDSQGGAQISSLCLVRAESPQAGEAPEALIAGACGGFFRTLNPADGPGATWTLFAQNAPSTYGQDIQHYPASTRRNGAAGDVLVASFYGRGAWIAEGVSAELFRPGILRIAGRTGSETVRLIRNANVPSLLEVYDTAGADRPRLTLPLASLEGIVVTLPGDDNTLVVDCSHGLIAVRNGIDYLASSGTGNGLVVRGGSVAEQHLRSAALFSGTLAVGGRMSVRYGGVQRIDDSVRSGRMTVRSAARTDLVEVSDAAPLDRRPALEVRQRLRSDVLRLKVTNVTMLALDLSAGPGRLRLVDFLTASAALRSLKVVTGAGANDIRIAGVPPGVAVAWEGGGGTDSVAVGTLTGSGGQLAQVRGPIELSNRGGRTMLSVSDADDQAVTEAVLSARALSGPGPARITFEQAGLASLTVAGSKAGTAFTVEGTGDWTTTLLGGDSANALQVNGTGGPLEYVSGDHVDRVLIGKAAGGPATLSGVRGPVRVRCSPAGNVNVTLDGRADGQPREVVVTDHAVIGMAPAEIDLTPGANPHLNSLSTRGGSARTFYSVVDTPPNFTLTLQGQGQDVVNLMGARQEVDISGATAVTVGSQNTGLTSVQGAVKITGGAPTTGVTVDDRGGAQPRRGAIEAGRISGLTSQPIDLDGTTLRALNVLCGAAGNVLVVIGTAAGCNTSVSLGSGQDRLDVRATDGPLSVSARPGAAHQVIVGSTAPDVEKDELATVKGEMRLGAGSDTVDLTVSDALGKVRRSGRLSPDAISGLAPANIAFAPLRSLTLLLSRAGNRLGVEGTPAGTDVRVRAGGQDTMQVTVSEHAETKLLVEGPAQSGDTLEVKAGGRPLNVAVTDPQGSSPGTIRVTYPTGVSVVAFRSIGRVIPPH